MLRVLGLEQRFSLLWFIFVAGIMVDTFFLLAPFSFLGSSWGPAGKMTPPPLIRTLHLPPFLSLLSYPSFAPPPSLLPLVHTGAGRAGTSKRRKR